tara:strand:- start:415 stop:744 length:330 start_codon:yes stop_codon:yes gene_type:complete
LNGFQNYKSNYLYERADELKNHTKILCDYWGYDIPEDIACVVCGNYAVDCHHIEPRKQGSSSFKDYPENLAPLCREHHTKAEYDPRFNAFVKTKLLEKIIDKVENDGRI